MPCAEAKRRETNMFEMNFSETIEAGKITMIGEPRQYRGDCKAGVFKLGKSEIVGKTLTLEPIGAKLVDDQLFTFDRQKWAEVLFVDESGLISSILLKGESLRNFVETCRKIVISGKAINALQLTARMAARANAYGEYAAVEFEIAGDGKFAEQIRAFEKDQISGMFRIDSLPRGKEAEPDAETTAVATTTRTIKRR